MKIFTQKDSELLISIIRKALKIIILIIMFLTLTTTPGIVFTEILSIMTKSKTEDIESLRIACWIICMVISFVCIIIKLNQKENVK